MVPITFGKVYRRLDSTKRYLEGSSFNLNPTVELIDNDPQYDAPLPAGNYLPKCVYIYVSNRNSFPTGPENMTFSDTIYTGSNNPVNKINAVYKINSSSTWIMFKKQNAADDIEGFTLDFFIRNSDSYNTIQDGEQNL
jgi:hypothetical protein